LVFLPRPGGAVDALEHLVAGVAAPVRPGYAHELEGLQLAGGRHVRPAAEVDPVALAVERDRVLLRDRGDDLGLVFLSNGRKVRDRLVARHLATLNRKILPCDLLHFFLYQGQVFRSERPLVGEVVIEAVLDHRTDRHLRFREKLFHRLRKEVGTRVAQDLKTFGIAFGDDLHVGIGLDAIAGVHQLAVHFAGKRRARESRADRSGDVGYGDGCGERLRRAVGQTDIGHRGRTCILSR
jgi:hypothetical protein